MQDNNANQEQCQSKTRNYSKVNTYTRKPVKQQIVAYSLMLLQIICFYGIVFDKINQEQYRYTILISYTLCLTAMVTAYCCASCVDPTDSHVIKIALKQETLMQIIRKQIQTSQAQSNQQQLLYCDICQMSVSFTAKHCKICDRCVQSFDHHCKWINNCIGGKNYKAFFAMTFFCFMKNTVFIIAVFVVTFTENWNQFLAQIILAWIILIISLFVWIFISILLFFHIYLKIMNKTTYGVIIDSRKNQIERRKTAIQQSLKKRQQQKRQSTMNDQPIEVIQGNIGKNKEEQSNKNSKNKVANSFDQSIGAIARNQYDNPKYRQVQEVLQYSCGNENEDKFRNPSDYRQQASLVEINSGEFLLHHSKSLRLIIGEIDFVRPKNSLSFKGRNQHFLSQRYSGKNSDNLPDQLPFQSK